MAKPVSNTMNADLRAQRSNLRRDALAILVRANKKELAGAWNDLEPRPNFEILRSPQAGLVMTRGRIGGGGASFNIGEVTVTRCVVRLDSGEIGFGHVLGRDVTHAELVARFDALLQCDAYREVVETNLLRRVAARQRRDDELTRQQTAATRVNFFTMVRGEDG